MVMPIVWAPQEKFTGAWLPLGDLEKDGGLGGHGCVGIEGMPDIANVILEHDKHVPGQMKKCCKAYDNAALLRV
jgi:hypothetical protein